MSSNKALNKEWRPKRNYSIAATWNAFRHLSYARFPLFLAGAHPILAPIIMFRLKQRGFSNCRVEILENGLLVKAER